MSFKEQMQSDLDAVFLDLDTFGEIHSVEDKKITVIIDDDELIRRQSGMEEGVSGSTILFFAKESDLPPRKMPDNLLKFDGKEYTIKSWNVSAGMATITLARPGMR